MKLSRTETALIERALIRYQSTLEAPYDTPLDAAVTKLLKRVERALLDDAAERGWAPRLNAVGKPYSPSYDPKYRIKHKVSTAHLFKPYGDNVRDHLTKWDA